jgi:hypothetical protein
MKKSKQSRAKEFSHQVRESIWIRDGGVCIFCRTKYHMEDTTQYGRSITDYMHYIGRAQGGLGIEQNGAVGCRDHHMMLDNGNKGRYAEMHGMFGEYLKSMYAGWDEKELVYKKY